MGDFSTVKRIYRHVPIEIEYQGIKASIQENGKVVLTKEIKGTEGEDTEYDEIEVPANLIYKLSRLLNDTRKS